VIVTVVVKNATLQGHIWEHLRKCIVRNAVGWARNAVQTVKKKRLNNMVKITITYDTERDSVSINAKMCGEAIHHIPEILDFVHSMDSKNKRREA
tara:strand:+ start:8849 stop:9133 length:285 start_codon:yes stop_codon:yes gene_type:complete